MSRVNFVKNNNALFWIFITNSIIVLPSTEALYKSAKTLFSIDYIYIYIILGGLRRTTRIACTKCVNNSVT